MRAYLLVLLLCVSSPAAGQPGSGQRPAEAVPPVGRVTGVRGKVYWKKDARAAAVRLDPRRDLNRRLFPGERLRCDKGGQLSLQLYGVPVELRESDDWYIIPRVDVGDRPGRHAGEDSPSERSGGREGKRRRHRRRGF